MVIHSHGGSGETENILLVELNQPDPDDGYSKGDDGSAHNRYYENVGTIKCTGSYLLHGGGGRREASPSEI